MNKAIFARLQLPRLSPHALCWVIFLRSLSRSLAFAHHPGSSPSTVGNAAPVKRLATWRALGADFARELGTSVATQEKDFVSSKSAPTIPPQSLLPSRRQMSDRVFRPYPIARLVSNSLTHPFALVQYVDETHETIQAHQARRLPRVPSPFPSPLGLTPGSTEQLSPPDDGVAGVPTILNLPPQPESLALQVESPSSVGTPSTRCWSFQGPTEVLLFEHFTQTLSSFFDMCDPERHFAIQVPIRARNYPPLMDAILALAARHMCLTGRNADSYLATDYYQRCLRVLIPELDGVQPDRVDDLLAATIILRLHEELDGPFGDFQTYRHSIGTRALLQSQAIDSSLASGLRRAGAWAGVRQEIYASIKLHRPPAMKPSPEMLEHLESLSHDGAWADRAVSHCLDVLDFCFGDNSVNGDIYDSLLVLNAQWESERPASYDPLCFHTRAGCDIGPEVSWDVRFHADWHAIGWAYRTLARILLVIHNPRQPRVGLNRISAWEKVLKEVHYSIKLLCSIAWCRATVPGPSLIACMAVWLAGDMVESGREQKEVLELLTATEAVHGWPTEDIRTELEGVWSSES
ncbi:hypothetical protein BJX62DRAFT_238587 [Aspergillus germanicus]